MELFCEVCLDWFSLLYLGRGLRKYLEVLVAVFLCFQVVFVTVKGWFYSWYLRSFIWYFKGPLIWFSWRKNTACVEEREAD
ncbi:hypothetical protein A4A49_25666 [Nicotiana attenuata]|uniref:Uncharacterized protein n=1 Tax=Nicotiana attenuata TaxID=49451 RepID=A0A314KL82_NICAT|nr:hypothetical protein A4A49_25666 [Nicotiana attenuata]